ncbi:restriction endonuclease subunit S [Kitasatospora sp. NBC_01250]|uniref:restriction endonuclease subunit S n=1 Tax=Kitasatospora sp. NBC_01250 TaxID=2903571 RepID=UPI002E38047D|nr:restriction endonuclease subunit S [Kitasatospora sp. NBC_01250]
MLDGTWDVRRVKTLAVKIGSGKTPSGGGESYQESGVVFLRSQNIHFDGLRLNDVAYIDDVTHREMRASQVRDGDVLLNITGASLGRTTYVPAGFPRANVNQHVCIVRPAYGVESRFLTYALSSLTVQEQISALQVGGNRDGLNFEQVGNLRLHIPQMEEQFRVANFLDGETGRIDALVKGQQALSKLLLERREAGVIEHVTGADHADHRASRLEWADSLPEDWPEVRLGLLARMGSGHTPSRSRPEWWVAPSIPWITTGEVSQVRDDRREVITETREKISELGLANSAAELHPAGTVVLCRTASAGYSAVMGSDMATSQDFATWTCGPRLDPFYLLWCLRAMRQDLLGRLAMGSTHKTIYVPDLQMLRIPLPDIREQQRIVGAIRDQNAAIDRLVDAVARQLALLAERRQALITAAVTGQFDVTTARGANVS